MKKILSLGLLAVSVSASAQIFNFKGTDFLFHTNLAASEMVKMENTVDAEGNPIVVMESRNGAIYKSKVKDVEVTLTPRSLPAKGSKFEHLIETAKEYKDIDELEFGDFIGVGTKHDYSFEEYLDDFYWLGERIGYDLKGTMKPFLQVNNAILGLKNGMAQENIRVQIYDIIYVGVDCQGQKAPFSARFSYIYNANEKNPITLTDIYVDNHVTLTSKGMEPSSRFWSFSSQPTITKGYFCVQPDLIGFGSTAGYSQQYIDKDINGADVAYAVVAAQQFIKWHQENKKEHGFKMSYNPTVINTGTSQGATTALAGTYFIENSLDKTKSPVNLKETHVCSGAYNMELSMDFFTQQDVLDYPIKVPAFFIGLATAHPELLTDGEKQLTLHDYFNPVSWMFEYQDGGVNYGNFWQAVDMNETARSAQACCAYTFWDVDAGGPSIRKMLTHDQFTPDLRHIDWNVPKLKGVKSFLDKNNLCDPNVWKPKAPIMLSSTPTDITIPPANTEEFYKNMKPYNEGMTLEVLDNIVDVFPPEMGYGDHMALCFVWYLSEITGLPLKIVNELIRKALEGKVEEATEMAKAAMIEQNPELAKALNAVNE